MSELSVVGRRVPMIDARVKVTGEAKYVSDVMLPGMLHGRILRSPLPHARIVSIDVSRAERLPGVKAVVTAQDTPKVRFGRHIADEHLLAVDRVRYIGDHVAAVAALTEEIAEEALGFIQVEYEELPFVDDPMKAMESDAPLIHSAERNIANHLLFNRGDIERGFREADEIVEGYFETSIQHQCYLETMGAVGEHNDGRTTLYLGAQIPARMRLTYADALGVSPDSIRVTSPFIGGGFGAKNDYAPHMICALLCKKAGRPVRLHNSRYEDFIDALPRLPMYITLTLAATRDGRITGKKAKIIADNGAYTHDGVPILATAATRPDNQFRIENMHTEAYLVYTNKVPTSAFRGFGNPQMTFALGQCVDMVADRLGLDPVEVLMKNIVRSGDTTAHGWYMGSCGLAECITEATRRVNWSERRRRDQAPGTTQVHQTTGNTRRGLGLATCLHVSGNRSVFKLFEGSSAFIRIGDDGVPVLFTGEVEIGQGSRTVFAQMIAEELGLSVTNVRVAGLDTDISPFCLGAYASRTTTLGGRAVVAAAQDARAKLALIAAEMLEANPEDLRFKGGAVFVQGAPDRSVPFVAVARQAVYQKSGSPVIGEGSFTPDNVVIPDSQTKYGNISVAYPFAAHVAEVEVDVRTGQVDVVNYVAAHDTGKTINPLAAEGQVEGGIVQGLGYALTEGLVIKNGRVVNPTFMDYKVMTPLDVPPIRSIFVESNDPIGPYGAKSLGEPVMVPVAAAIANAIYDAVGVRITMLPITADKVRAAIRRQTS